MRAKLRSQSCVSHEWPLWSAARCIHGGQFGSGAGKIQEINSNKKHHRTGRSELSVILFVVFNRGPVRVGSYWVPHRKGWVCGINKKIKKLAMQKKTVACEKTDFNGWSEGGKNEWQENSTHTKHKETFLDKLKQTSQTKEKTICFSKAVSYTHFRAH